jgi:hypothetical protein
MQRSKIAPNGAKARKDPCDVSIEGGERIIVGDT